jgi:hypothetical protein
MVTRLSRCAGPGHRPDGVTQPGQVRREGVADLAGTEHYLEPVVAHELVPVRAFGAWSAPPASGSLA